MEQISAETYFALELVQRHELFVSQFKSDKIKANKLEKQLEDSRVEIVFLTRKVVGAKSQADEL
ncbi:unnamed protein product [Ilex paraguariensis]|uniref:Uncharacterized protein n=1 Tax=Ilex paraguariensis TaxID=185542 RepID=A0ABC8R710_9AQUA